MSLRWLPPNEVDNSVMSDSRHFLTQYSTVQAGSGNPTLRFPLSSWADNQPGSSSSGLLSPPLRVPAEVQAGCLSAPPHLDLNLINLNAPLRIHHRQASAPFPVPQHFLEIIKKRGRQS